MSEEEPRTATMIVCPPPATERLSMDDILGVGFGIVYVIRDGETVWQGDSDRKKVRSAEGDARRDPDHEWTIYFYGPMSDETYTRFGRDDWRLTSRGQGFA